MKKIVALLLTVAFFAISGLDARSSEGLLNQEQIQDVNSESGVMDFIFSGVIIGGDPSFKYKVYVKSMGDIYKVQIDEQRRFYIPFECDGTFSWGIEGLPKDEYTCVMTRSYGFYFAEITIISKKS